MSARILTNAPPVGSLHLLQVERAHLIAQRTKDLHLKGIRHRLHVLSTGLGLHSFTLKGLAQGLEAQLDGLLHSRDLVLGELVLLGEGIQAVQGRAAALLHSGQKTLLALLSELLAGELQRLLTDLDDGQIIGRC